MAWSIFQQPSLVKFVQLEYRILEPWQLLRNLKNCLIFNEKIHIYTYMNFVLNINIIKFNLPKSIIIGIPASLNTIFAVFKSL